jgi:hypothetical protein
MSTFLVLCSPCNAKLFCSLTDAYEPLSGVIPISKNKLTPYRAVIIMRLIVLGLFFHYRITNHVYSAFGLWMTLVICEIRNTVQMQILIHVQVLTPINTCTHTLPL